MRVMFALNEAVDPVASDRAAGINEETDSQLSKLRKVASCAHGGIGRLLDARVICFRHSIR